MKRAALGLIILMACITLLAQEPIDYSVYLIGDTGSPQLDGSDPVFSNLEKKLQTAGKSSAIVFLGDNIYHNGLPQENDPTYLESKHKMDVQLDAIQDYKGKIYYVPGNHDWNDAKVGGVEYIRRQEKYIESYLDRGDVMLPDDGCPGPETKKLGKDIVLVAMDSHWWLHPHTDEELRSADCGNKNPSEIIQELVHILNEEKDKLVIIAMHHPLFSDGSHNGHYTLKDHLFPLANLSKGLYIPLPVIGSLYPFYRSAFGAKQDMPHPLYKHYVSEMLFALSNFKNVILASGHEHNLQYFYVQGNHFVKSGSGSKSSPLPKMSKAEFSATDKGYARVDHLESSEVKLTFVGIDEKGNDRQLDSRTIIEAPLQFGEIGTPYELPVQDKKLQPSEQYDKGGFHRMIFGNLYRDDWSTPTTYPSLNLSTVSGGLQPIKVGGGLSSKSIRLKSKESKKQYVLRSVEKGVKKVVPPGFEGSFVETIFQDQIAAAQPYAALAVPPLADAVGVYHTNPQLIYLPEQPLLGAYNSIYGNNVYLFEERPSGNQEDNETFGNSRKIISYRDMLERLQKNSKHHVHQEQVLLSRLFDFYLGDWDRHDDQWRWATFKAKNYKGGDETHTYYEPIPRDRDQVFYRYKGLVPMIARLASPQLRKFQNWDEHTNKINFLGFNARHFDRNFLNELDEKAWMKAANKFKTNLTDEVIKEAIQTLPPEIQELRGKEFRKILRARRERMPEYAQTYYKFLSKYVTVAGTAKRENFEVERRADGSTYVAMFQRKKDGTIDDKLYERIFLPNESKEVRLYGLGEEDHFNITGKHSGGPIIRIIGGYGKDQVNDDSKLNGGKKSVIVYDDLTENDINLGPDSKDNRSNNYKANLYDRKEFYYNSSVSIPFLAFNPDDILRASYILNLQTYGFHKAPYNMRHQLGFNYSLGQGDLRVGYDLHQTGALGKMGWGLNAHLFAPNDVDNFFGLSNEKTLDVDDFADIEYFRYDKVDLSIEPSLRWTSAAATTTFSLGPYYQIVNVGDNDGKFLTEEINLASSEFETKNYTGLRARLKMNKVDNPGFPTSGIRMTITPSYNLDTKNSEESFLKLQGDIRLYNFLWMPRPFVLATRINFGINFSDEFSFVQGNYLGRRSGLRSFRNNRFGGRSSFVVSNDLRWPIIRKKGGSLPFSIGLIGSFDHGRTWINGEDSDQWHTSYGGGIWFSPLDVMPISVYYLTSNEDAAQVLISVGFGI